MKVVNLMNMNLMQLHHHAIFPYCFYPFVTHSLLFITIFFLINDDDGDNDGDDEALPLAFCSTSIRSFHIRPDDPCLRNVDDDLCNVYMIRNL
ncbi:hypothetical protein Lalb_Chr06g0175631 [Lupinus albus]|uniref:Transmembrane protein n=1 Tax=Lupinus albus TaxID=3870 RepID=A0A6A4QF26_LUPAL|nr:hypothetical protein Lalb_Chr06g0175631 [Lupinus albus]